MDCHIDGLRASLASTHQRYARAVNERYEWRGHPWQERYYSFPMDEPHLFAAVRYVERNPVAAGLCPRAEDWPWSSAPAHLAGHDDVRVEMEPMLARVEDWSAYLAEPNPVGFSERIARHSRKRTTPRRRWLRRASRAAHRARPATPQARATWEAHR